jgi:hypothetical protein
MESAYIPLEHGDDILSIGCTTDGLFYVLSRSFAFAPRPPEGVDPYHARTTHQAAPALR